MPKMKPTRKKAPKTSPDGSEPLAGKTASEMFLDKSQRDLLNHGLDSLREESAVYKGLFKK